MKTVFYSLKSYGMRHVYVTVLFKLLSRNFLSRCPISKNIEAKSYFETTTIR